ncbi:hypothetical protein NDU88_006926 [Pleurodeles waltl]|uniref:Uncharacterized protein n=1 Tax=Pleurodeles waltl TaxID=8319 RepID=A0AAV7SRB3_PLEWA|nr:hypothetical protein NDU88_006926 [Pleurodeles waltl]
MRHPRRALFRLAERKRRHGWTGRDVLSWKKSQRGWKRRDQRGRRLEGRRRIRLQTSSEESQGCGEERESQPGCWGDVAKPSM